MYTYMTKVNGFQELIHEISFQLNPSVGPTTFGLAVTFHGVGHCLGALAAAWWTNRRYKAKKPLMAGYILMLFSNCLFLLADHVPTELTAPFIMMCRFLGGLGMGNTSTLRTTLTAHSMSDDRAKAMSVFIGGRALGLILGPGLQLIFLFFGDTGLRLIGSLHIHSHNAAAFISIILNLSAIVALFTLYHEIERNGSSCSQRSIEDDENWPLPDKLAMFVCMLTRYCQNFTYYAIETLAPAFIMMMFNMERDSAVGIMSVVFFISGVFAITLYSTFVFSDVARRLNIGKVNTASLLIFMIYILSTYQWPFIPTNVFVTTDGSHGGCDYSIYSWCLGLPKTSQEFFYIGYIISFGGCVPFINVGDATLYSKLFNPVGQALEQSLYDVSQIFARVVAPVLCTAIYSSFGPQRVWELLFAQLVVVTFLWIAFANRMIPLRPKPRPVFYLE
uniref:MFS domain-containing protein n=1 Tax=Caenorhabditis tropicalis TaxID=1561998 RepID=A0A1I7U2A3_9PELO